MVKPSQPHGHRPTHWTLSALGMGLLRLVIDPRGCVNCDKASRLVRVWLWLGFDLFGHGAILAHQPHLAEPSTLDPACGKGWEDLWGSTVCHALEDARGATFVQALRREISPKPRTQPTLVKTLIACSASVVRVHQRVQARVQSWSI